MTHGVTETDGGRLPSLLAHSRLTGVIAMDWIISLIVFIVIVAAIFAFARSRRPKVQPPTTGGGASSGGRKQDQV